MPFKVYYNFMFYILKIKAKIEIIKPRFLFMPRRAPFFLFYLIPVLCLCGIFALPLHVSAAAPSGRAPLIIEAPPKDACALFYAGDFQGYGDYLKWSPVYDYIISAEFGGIYLTERGRGMIEKFEQLIKMPIGGLYAIFGKEIALWLEPGDFNEIPPEFGAAFIPQDMQKLRSIIDDNFINAIDASSKIKIEKLGYGDYSYFVDFEFDNPFIDGKNAGSNDKMPESSAGAGGKYIKGRFAFASIDGLFFVSSSKDYLSKIVEYYRASHEQKPVFADFLKSCKDGGRTGIFINFELLAARGLKALKDRIAALENDSRGGENPQAGKTPGGAAAGVKSADLKILSAALDTLGISGLKSFSALHWITDDALCFEARLLANECRLLKFAGPDIDYINVLKLCPADASSAAVCSIDFTAIIDAVDAVVEKLPLTSRAGYFMIKSSIMASCGMRLKEDIVDMLSNELIVINKIFKNKSLDLWVNTPTIIVKLKNPAAAEKLLAKLNEKKLLANFEVKEYMGRKYFSLPLPGQDKQFLTMTLTGGYFIFSLSFDHFTSVIRNISAPQNSITELKKFKEASARCSPKAFYFIYTSDDDLAEYYIETQFKRDKNIMGAGGFAARYDYSKINWEKVRRRQAPTVGTIRRSDDAFIAEFFGAFRRD